MCWSFYDIVDWFMYDLFDGLFSKLLGWKSAEERFSDDLILTLTKAHLGKLPQGQYAEQYVSAKTFSRDELRVPLDAETLRRMNACVTVCKHDVQLRTVSSKMDMHSRVTVLLSLSLQFAGEMADGEVVTVDISHALLLAHIERDKVRGMALRTLKEIKGI